MTRTRGGSIRRFVRARLAATLVAVVAGILSGARAAPPGWGRLDLGRGISVEVPATWTVHRGADPSPVTLREYPSEETIAAVTFEVVPRTSSLEWWRKFHREKTLPELYPNGKIVHEEPREAGPFSTVYFHVKDLGGERSDYELFETLAVAGRSFVTISFFVPRGQSRRYTPVFDRISASITLGDEPVETPPPPPAGSGSSRTPAREPAPSVPSDRIAWARDFDEAFAEARRRNVPVMIAFNMDGEPANEQMVREHYRNKEVVELSKKMVCLIASTFDHGGYRTVDGKAEPCPRFGGICCPDHRDVEIRARETYLRARKAVAPQHLFCAPDGRLLLRREWLLPVGELVNLMRRSISAVRRDAGAADREAIEPLLAAYENAPDDSARHWIVSDALFGGRPEIAAAFLEALVASADEEGLVVLLDGIGLAGHPDGAPTAVRALDHPAPKVRSHAAIALEQIGSPDAATAAAVERRIVKEREETVLKNLVRALGACAAEEAGAAKILLARARSGPSLVRVNALVALKHFPENEQVTAALLAILRSDPDARVRAGAAWTLGMFEEAKAEPLLEAALASPPDDLARRVFELALAKIRGELDWKVDYAEILENLAGDEVIRR